MFNESMLALVDSELFEYLPSSGEDDTTKQEISRNAVDMTPTFISVATYTMQGLKNSAIAEQLGLSVNKINTIKKSEPYKEVSKALVGEITDIARGFLATAGFKATKTLISLLDSPNEAVALKASIEVLNRLNIKAPDELIVTAKQEGVDMDEAQMKALIRSTATALSIAERGEENNVICIEAESADGTTHTT